MSVEAGRGVLRLCPHCAEDIPASASVCDHCSLESPAWVWENGYWWRRDPDNRRVWFQLLDGTGEWQRYEEDTWRQRTTNTLVRAVVGAAVGLAAWVLVMIITLIFSTGDDVWAEILLQISFYVLVLGGAIRGGMRHRNRE